MRVLVAIDPAFWHHDPGEHHPEHPSRLDAVVAGLDRPELAEHLSTFGPTPAPRAALVRVHPGRYVSAVEELAVAGGGRIDADTVASDRSFDAASLAAGAGLEAIRRLEAGEGDAAFCAVRPPGHHATPHRPMGFCLLNNAAVAAAALADRGERVLVVDYDAHHGNGTQDIFYEDGRVAYVSLHEYPAYPGTGALDEAGTGEGAGLTVNVPFRWGTTGPAYRRAVDDVVVPLAEAFGPTWLILSAGFDAHRSDPLTDLGLTAGDFADLTRVLCGLVPPGRRLAFLEGGYDLGALTDSVAAAVGALAGVDLRPEPASATGPGDEIVAAVRAFRDQHGWA